MKTFMSVSLGGVSRFLSFFEVFSVFIFYLFRFSEALGITVMEISGSYTISKSLYRIIRRLVHRLTVYATRETQTKSFCYNFNQKWY